MPSQPLLNLINEDFAVDFHADHLGTQKNYEAVNEAVINLRSGKKIDRSWKEGIERDYNRRSNPENKNSCYRRE